MLELTVPAAGRLSDIASEVAARVAEHLGAGAPDAQSIGARVDEIVSALGERGAPQGTEITFEFRRAGAELVIHVRCDGVASEVRHPLPA